MNREDGDKAFPIWLIGDSNPPQWEDKLEKPLDPRHPIRHNIWNPVLDVIQDRVFREFRGRMDTSKIYVRNAIEKAKDKPLSNAVVWEGKANTECQELGQLLQRHQPVLVLCFGAFAYEFARRANGETLPLKYGYWGAKELGQRFTQRISRFDASSTNILPLLHRSIAGGRFVSSHNCFCGKKGDNYFDFVGNTIAEMLILHRDKLKIWIS